MERRRLVLDANILIRAVLGRRVREILINHAADVDIFSPAVAFDDAAKHLPAVLTKHDRADEIESVLTFLDRLRQIVVEVPERAYIGVKAEALARIERRDPDDWTVLATAMLLDCPLWTEDKDFFGTGVSTWTTDRIGIYLDPPP